MKDMHLHISDLVKVLEQLPQDATDIQRVYDMNYKFSIIVERIYNNAFQDGLKKGLNITNDLELLIDSN